MLLLVGREPSPIKFCITCIFGDLDLLALFEESNKIKVWFILSLCQETQYLLKLAGVQDVETLLLWLSVSWEGGRDLEPYPPPFSLVALFLPKSPVALNLWLGLMQGHPRWGSPSSPNPTPLPSLFHTSSFRLVII